MPSEQLHRFESRGGEEMKFEYVEVLSADGARFTVWSGERESQIGGLEDDVQIVASSGVTAHSRHWRRRTGEEFAAGVRHTTAVRKSRPLGRHPSNRVSPKRTSPEWTASRRPHAPTDRRDFHATR